MATDGSTEERQRANGIVINDLTEEEITQLGGYPTLFLSVAVITVLGSAFVWKIRSVP